MHTPSKAFVRAALKEREALARRHRALSTKHRDLQARADAVADQIADVDRQLATLAQLVGDLSVAIVPPTSLLAPPAAPDPSLELLSGQRVRAEAIRLLLSAAEPFAPIHYTDWFALLAPNGYAVRAKNPPAAFLALVRASPAVLKDTRPGVYRLDPHVQARLRRDLATANSQLIAASHSAADGAAKERAAQRGRLVARIARFERQLAELDAVYASPLPVTLTAAA